MKVVVIEGLDGAGKSTQINMLRNYLVGRGISHEYLHFPRTEAPWYGELISRFLRGEFGSAADVDPYLVAILYAGDRNDAAAEIRSWLKENKLVLLDRYTYSNIAYQCAKLTDAGEREKLRKWITELEFSHFGIPEPDLNIFLDVPFSFTERKLKTSRAGVDRSYLNGSSDVHEADTGFQSKVREIYLETAQRDHRLTIIDCSDGSGGILNQGDVFDKILNVLNSKKIIQQ
jgi:dTMP kinase